MYEETREMVQMNVPAASDRECRGWSVDPGAWAGRHGWTGRWGLTHIPYHG